MIAPTFATLSCCGARATASNIVGHKCNSAGRSSVEGHPRKGGDVGPAPTRQSVRPGQAAEDALVAALRADGQEVIDYRAWLWRALDGTRYEGWVTQFNVGALLATPRRFYCDLFLPSRRLIVESVGAAHIAGRAKLRRDTERTGLLVAAGLRVLPVNAGEIESAVAIVRAAVGGA